MGRQVVGNDVDLPAPRLRGYDLAEEVDKRCAGVARHGLSQHLAGLGIQCGEEREGAVSVVFETVPLGATGGQRQYGIEPGWRSSSAANTTA